MNALKRFLALALCLVLVVGCFTGCHKKGEIAVTIGNEEFTSGYYGCALVFADMDGRERVNSTLNATALTGKIEYWKQTIDGMEYTKWVENAALDKLKLIAAVKTLCKQQNVTPSDTTKAAFDQITDQLWLDSNVSSMMEENGVARETFKDFAYYSYLVDSSFFESYFGLQSSANLTNPLFNAIYGEGGTQAISKEDLENHLLKNYVLVNMLEVSFTGLTDEEKTDKKNQYTAYEKALKEKTKTFEEIYYEVYPDEKPKETDKETADDKAETETSGPKDFLAIPLAAESTSLAYGFDEFETVKAMAVGEIKIITLEENKGLILVVKKDILEDPYYITNGDTAIRKEIVGEGFLNLIKTQANGLECNVNTKSTRQFKVKKIYYPETTY